MAFGFRKKNKLSDINYLELTPVVNYEHKTNEKGLVDVMVPRFNDRIFGRFLQPKLKDKYIYANLDEIGSQTWLLIDGKNKVYEIIEALDNHFGEKVQPVYDRLTMFLTQLYKNGFISFKELSKG